MLYNLENASIIVTDALTDLMNQPLMTLEFNVRNFIALETFFIQIYGRRVTSVNEVTKKMKQGTYSIILGCTIATLSR